MNAVFLEYQNLLFSDDRLLIAIAAIIIVSMIGVIRGGIAGNANPFLWLIINIAFGGVGDKMNKMGRPKGDLIFRGFVLTVVVIAIAFFMGKILSALAYDFPFWSVIEIGALCLVLSSGAIFAAIGQLYKALNHKKKITPGAYYTIARTSFTDLSKNDDYTITRVGMGMMLKSFDKSIVAPILWYLILGLPGAFIYAALAALSWRFGKDGYSNGFGQSIVALEKLIGYVPNVVSGLLIALAGLVTPTAGMTRAFLGLTRPFGQAKYEEGGLPMTAAAYALNVSLGGPTTDLNGDAIPRGWIGPKGATAQLKAVHLHRVAYITFIAHLLWLLGLGSALIFA